MTETSVAGGGRATVAAADSATEFRAELLMALDLLVRAERVVRSESSMFTRSIGRVPDVLGSLTHYYRIDIARATRNQLLVVASGEGRKNVVTAASIVVGDRVSIDENFRVNSNFPMPAPPRDYLHTLARSVMNHAMNNQFLLPTAPELEMLEGVFRGYFHYEVRPVSTGKRTIVAIGLKGVVKGDVVEVGPGVDLYEWVYHHRNTVWVERELYGHLEKIYLAERIHQQHTGSYSPEFKNLLSNWIGLAGLTSEHSPLVVQDFQLDPTFGFHAELAQRVPASSPDSLLGRGDRAISGMPDRVWSVNGYGQVSEVATVERIVDQFEQARKRVASHGDAISEYSSRATGQEHQKLVDEIFPEAENPLKDLPGSQAGMLLPARQNSRSDKADADKGRKPLLIDAVENDK